MYLPTLGGSGLLHLLAAHPRVVAIFGVAATVGALMAPHAPGRLVGTAGHIERVESAIGTQFVAVAEERQTAAEEQAVRLLDQNDRKQIEAAVARLLRTCGPACTDISTDRVVSDRSLLVRVLMLSELDKLAHTPQPNVADAASHTNRPASRTN
jgi:hypothetical protein